MKQYLRGIVAAILGWQIRRLQQNNTFKIVVIAGSIGKTSTKFAVASVLKGKYRVLYQEGNYNDLVSVPLVFFQQAMPSVTNIFAWLKIFMSNERQINKEYPFDVVVLELGTDGPGQIKQFSEYLQADISVITAISPEHMEQFHTLSAVAREELQVTEFSNKVLVNKDLCAPKFLDQLTTKVTGYGMTSNSSYRVEIKEQAKKNHITIAYKSNVLARSTITLASRSRAYSLAAAVAVANMLGLTSEEIAHGLTYIDDVPGRLQLLDGKKNSTIIDDTYNSSPVAALDALSVLYGQGASQKIAVLGNMNELGNASKAAHRALGAACDPKKVDVVVTLGKDANRYTAEVAKENGCSVYSVESPVQAAEIVLQHLKDGGVILCKGSQNGVFLEEAVKILLANWRDKYKLVRQSDYWMREKTMQFPDLVAKIKS